jgi:predicted DNA-binding protein
MSTRSVRLDQEAEQALEDLVEKTGASLSTILKRGILALRDRELGDSAQSAYEIYDALDLGPGGYALAPARSSQKGVREAIRKRHGR